MYSKFLYIRRVEWSWSFLDYFETFNKKKTFVYRYRKKYVEFFFPKK